MKIDIHTHTSNRSGCGRSTAHEMAAAAVEIGIDCIFLTDHHKYAPLEELKDLNETFPELTVYGGIEVTVTEQEDIVVLGVNDPILAIDRLPYKDLYNLVTEQNGFLSLAHPFRYNQTIGIEYESLPPHAIEIHSSNTGNCDADTIRQAAHRAGSHLIHASDAHHISMIGVYHIEISAAPQNEAETIAALKAGNYGYCAIEERVRKHNAKISAIETGVADLIAAGKDREYYISTIGRWGGYYDRIAMGGSYQI